MGGGGLICKDFKHLAASGVGSVSIFGKPVVTTNRRHGALSAENGGEVRLQRIQPDVLDRDDLMVDGGLLASAGGLSNVHPVGCLVASAARWRWVSTKVSNKTGR